MLYQLSYEATNVGGRPIVGSYVPVKEKSVNDTWNKSYITCENAEMKWKWRNDRRSECNLCNCVKKPKKKKNSGLQRGLSPWPRDTDAMLYQLSYEATDVGGRPIVGS